MIPRLSRLAKDDLPSLLALSQEAGWPHTARDWTAVLECGTGYGHREGKEVVSCVHLTDFGLQFASLGLMIVAKSRRGQGLGKSLLQHALSRRSRSQSIGLIAGRFVPSFYEQFGFRTIRDNVLVLRKEQVLGPRLLRCCNSFQPITNKNVQNAVDFDEKEIGLKRRNLLEHRLTNADRTFIFSKDDSIQAYGMANTQGQQLALGPLVSLNTPSALELVHQLTADFDGLLRIDAYERQSDFITGLVEDQGYRITALQPVMMKGPHQQLPGNRNLVFSPASQAWT